MRNYSIILFFLFIGVFTLNAQDLGLSMMKNVYQSNTLNPAVITKQKFIFSFPGLTTSVGSSGLSYNDIVTTNSAGEKVIVADEVIAKLKNKNTIWNSTDVETFHVAFGGKNWQVSLGHAVKYKSSFQLPKSLAQITLQGNEQFIGQEVNIAPEFAARAYGEFSLGTAIKLSRLTLGIKGKLLSGAANFSSANAVASIYTSDEGAYDLTLNTDYSIRAAGLVQASGLDNSEESSEIVLEDFDFNDLIMGENAGFAIDLGATFEVNDRLTISGSILDLGKINWSQNPNTYTSQGSYEYKGLNLVNIIENDEASFEQIADTLSDIFQFQKDETPFSTGLPMRSYWTANYELSNLFMVGGLIHTRHNYGQMQTTLAVSGTMTLGNWWSLGTVISHGASTGFAVGGNTMLKLGPVQLFFATDNLVSVFKPLDSSYAHGRLGLNLAFGNRD